MGDLKRLVREVIWLFTDEQAEIEINNDVISIKLKEERSFEYFQKKGQAVKKNLKKFIEALFDGKKVEIKVLRDA